MAHLRRVHAATHRRGRSVTFIGPGSSAKRDAPPARRAPGAPWAPRRAESASRSQPEPCVVPTAIQGPQIPAWLAAANRVRATLAAADHRTDQERNAAWSHDWWVLARLAELSERISPWDAAREIFGGDQ